MRLLLSEYKKEKNRMSVRSEPGLLCHLNPINCHSSLQATVVQGILQPVLSKIFSYFLSSSIKFWILILIFFGKASERVTIYICGCKTYTILSFFKKS